jgi:hypothetical protein
MPDLRWLVSLVYGAMMALPAGLIWLMLKHLPHPPFLPGLLPGSGIRRMLVPARLAVRPCPNHRAVCKLRGTRLYLPQRKALEAQLNGSGLCWPCLPPPH